MYTLEQIHKANQQLPWGTHAGGEKRRLTVDHRDPLPLHIGVNVS